MVVGQHVVYAVMYLHVPCAHSWYKKVSTEVKGSAGCSACVASDALRVMKPVVGATGSGVVQPSAHPPNEDELDYLLRDENCVVGQSMD